jgi:serine O-acetyltransferase
MTDMPSATDPDWFRETPRRWWDPSRRLLRSIRKYQSLQNKRSLLATAAQKWWALQHRFWTVITQAEIPLTASIGGGLLLPHPNGIVVHPDASIGANCLIFQQVTIGTVGSRPGAPRIGGHVDMGAGARILGPVTIGDHAVVGANAVVLSDVPAYGVAVGVPAKIRDLPPESGPA